MAKGESWVEVETAEVSDEKTPWVTPEAGTVVKGELVRAFLVKQDTGNLTVGLQIEKEDGSKVNLGERFFFSEAVRGINLNSQVEITFLEEKPLKKGRTQWVGKFRYMQGKGMNVYKALKEDYDKRYGGGGDEVPF